MFKTINGGKMPQRGSKYSACVDLFANEDCTIGAGATKAVGVGVCIDLDELFKNVYVTHKTLDEALKILNEQNNNIRTSSSLLQEWEMFKKSHYLQLMPRSSLGKKGLILQNGVGVIDLDYPDEIKMIIHNSIQYIEDDGHIDLQLYGAVDTYAPKTSRYERKYIIKKGDKIGQITLLEHKSYLFGINTEEERTGGIGSTGL